MEKLDKIVPVFDKQSNRFQHNSIYRKTCDLVPDYYDSIKIAAVDGDLKSTKKQAFIDIKKQTNRDLTKMLQTTEQFKNIKRDNERADYIKKLLAGN